MRLELSRMRAAPGQPFTVSGEEDIPKLDWWGETLSLEGKVRADVIAFYQEGRVFLTLKVRGRIHRRCSRCLAELVEDFDRKDFLEVPVEEAGAYLELRGLIESGVRLAISPRPLCRPDCRGLCPGCGADLNVEDHRPGCEVKKPPPDPRLEKLRELL
jgi:uncharacterized protein